MSHTSGPWKIGRVGAVRKDDAVVSSQNFIVASIQNRIQHRPYWNKEEGVSHRVAPKEEIDANLRLIAAAPDLLVYLEWALQCVKVGMDELGINPENSEAMQEAISLVNRLNEGPEPEESELPAYGEPCEGRR